jgi:hypothetical protein
MNTRPTIPLIDVGSATFCGRPVGSVRGRGCWSFLKGQRWQRYPITWHVAGTAENFARSLARNGRGEARHVAGRAVERSI